MNKKLIFLLISAIVFTYVIIRAVVLGITYDEAWTIQSFVPQSIYHIFSYDSCDANNQILNTVLIKVFFITGNHSLLVARLPNVFAFLIYAYFCYKIAQGFLNRITGIALFIILLFNPFVLDFFGLARGYGLAMTFQMAAIFHLLQFLKTGKHRNYAYSLVLSILATLSNFTFLYFFISVLFAGNYISLLRNRLKARYVITLITGILLSLLLAFLIYTPIIKLVKNHGLYYGGNTGFYHDTLLSMSAFSLYHPYNLSLAQLILNIFLIALSIIILLNIFNKERTIFDLFAGKAAIILLVTALTILITLLNHFISGTLYLTDRTALMFFPLIIMVIIFYAGDLHHRLLKIPAVIIVMLIALSSLVNFGANASFVKTILWPFDAHTENILSRINSIGINEKKIKTIDYSWLMESSVHYYMNKNQYPNVQIVKDQNDREKLNVHADYYIYYNKSQEKVGYYSDRQFVQNIKKDTAWVYSSEDTYVFTNLDTISYNSNR